MANGTKNRKPVTDPNLLRMLGDSTKRVTDPNLLSQLDGEPKKQEDDFWGNYLRNFASPVPGVEGMLERVPDVMRSAESVLPYLDPRFGASRIAQDPEKAIGVGQTALEVGLPFLASPLPPPLRVPASGALQGTGTLVGEAARSAFVGPRKPLGEQFEAAGESALYGMGGELGGLGLQKLLKIGTAPFAKQVDQEVLSQVKEMGIKALPSELLNEQQMGSKFYKKFEHVIGGTLTGGPPINKLRTERIDAILDFGRKKADELLGGLKGATDIQTSTVNALEASTQAFRQEASKIYKQLDKATRGIGTDISPVKAFAQRELARIPAQARVAAGKGGAQASALLEQLESIAKLPDSVPFEDAHFWRSQLLETVRSDRSPIGGRIKGTASRMSDLFENRMEKAAASFEKDPRSIAGRLEFQGRKLDPSGNVQYEEFKIVDPNSPANNANISVRPGDNLVDRVLAKEREFGKVSLTTQMREANKFYREGKELFNNSFLARIAEKDPEKLIGNIIKPQNSNIVTTVKKVVDKDTWQSIKRAEVENWLNAAVKQRGEGGERFIDGKSLLNKWKSLGEETRTAIFEPAERQAFEKYINTVSKLGTKEQGLNIVGQYQLPILMGSGVGAGTAFGLGSSAGGIGAMAVGATSMVAPNVVSRLITSADGRKLLTEGFRLIPGTSSFVRHMTRIAVYLQSQSQPELAQPAVQDATRR